MYHVVPLAVAQKACLASLKVPTLLPCADMVCFVMQIFVSSYKAEP